MLYWPTMEITGPTAAHSGASSRATHVTEAQRDAYVRDGFFRIEGFAEPEIGAALLRRVIELARRAGAGGDIGTAFVTPEQQQDFARARVDGETGTGTAPAPEELASKIFRVAREDVFFEFASSAAVLNIVREVLGFDDVANFLSQFIFKNPGAWGQPWHQDSFYFPFDPPRPVVGIWLAVTEATLENGCLHVLAGSHTEPVHVHLPDARPGANYGYTEIVDHDMSSSSPVLMQPGDLLVFDSHLMHRSTDNTSASLRAAMVYHYARHGTVDRTEQLRGYTVNDWIPMPAPAPPSRRASRAAPARIAGT